MSASVNYWVKHIELSGIIISLKQIYLFEICRISNVTSCLIYVASRKKEDIKSLFLNIQPLKQGFCKRSAHREECSRHHHGFFVYRFYRLYIHNIGTVRLQKIIG